MISKWFQNDFKMISSQIKMLQNATKCQNVKMPRYQDAKSNCQLVIKMSNQNFKSNLNPNCVIFFLWFVCCVFSFKHSTITDVVRYLSCPEFKDVIEIVQLSRVQAAGNLVFTQAILLACDGPMPKEMVSQAFIGACMRSVCVRSCSEPKTVFKHKEMWTIPTEGTTGSDTDV